MFLKRAISTPIPVSAAPMVLVPQILPVSPVTQAYTNWCWAACCEMIFKSVSFRHDSQCQLASVVFNPEDCCFDGDPCNHPQPNSDIFQIHFGFPFQPRSGSLAPNEIEQEINDLRPVEVLWEWTGKSTAHLILIIGVYPSGDLEVIDPRRYHGQARFSYAEVESAKGAGVWIFSYYELNKV